MKFQSPVALTTGRIVAASVVLASLCNAPAFAAPQDAAKKEAVDPSGTWHWEHDENGVSVKDALTLNYDRKANQLTGRYKGNIGPIKIENGRIDGDKLEFRFDVDLEGTKIGLKFDGVIKGEEVNGTVSIDASGQTAEFPWTAARSLEPEDVAGTWSLKLETPDGNTLTPTVKFTVTGDSIKGDYTGLNGQFQAAAKDVTVKDGKLMFTVSGERDGNTLTAKYTVTPKGDSLSGKIAYDINGNAGELDVIGTRKTDEK
ncbi:MAG: hypothetical protein R3C19_24020 [Planctomycetaceae bacterium]